MTAIASKCISYTFGAGQAEGIDNVTVPVTVGVENPLTGDVTPTTVNATVQLPSGGWGDADVLKALQEKFPTFTVAWEVPPVGEAPAEEV